MEGHLVGAHGGEKQGIPPDLFGPLGKRAESEEKAQ